MQRQTATLAVAKLPPQFLLFLLATTAFALYIAISPGPENNWWLGLLNDALTVMTALLVGAQLILASPSRAAQQIWSIAFAVFVIVSICQFAEPMRGPFYRFLAIDDMDDCLLLVTAPVFLWATAKFEPMPVAGRRVLWAAFVLQAAGVVILLMERSQVIGADVMAQELTNHLIDFITMQLYLVAAALYITNGMAPGKSLVALVQPILKGDYYVEPVNGLRGKHSPEERLIGLEPVLAQAKASTVLDLGCAEGLIASEFIRLGANWVDGFDVVPRRIKIANDIVSGSKARFRAADLDDWAAFEGKNQLSWQYDIVLFLGIYQHLSGETRRQTLRGAVSRCRRYFAVRAPSEMLSEIADILNDAGFVLTGDVGQTGQGVGHVNIYERGRIG